MATDMIAQAMAMDAAANGADPSNYYNKSEVDSALAAKANTADLGTAAEADTTTSITSGGTGVPTANAVYEALAAKISMRDILGYGTVIPASTAENPQDLNNYASMGVFTIETSAVAATIDNAPVAFPGRLFVLAGATAGANIQMYITGENLYIRRRTTSLEWKPWVSMV